MRRIPSRSSAGCRDRRRAPLPLAIWGTPRCRPMCRAFARNSTGVPGPAESRRLRNRYYWMKVPPRRKPMGEAQDCVGAFVEAACVPLDAGHASGTLDDARAILASDPGLAGRSIHAAAILGDDIAVRGWLEKDAGLATSKGGPRGWDALTYLCFSRYLRLDEGRSQAFVRAATALLDAGADPNSGWYENNHRPEPEWESALYGAAGVAHHEGLTRLLLARGADPNDGETPYHAPESYDMGVLRALVESGKLSEESLATILLRKTDWHHEEAIRWLLERGVDPNRM